MLQPNWVSYDAYFSGGCYGICREKDDVVDGECSGIGCCQASMPKGLKYYNVTLHTLHKHSGVFSFNKCGYGFLVEDGKFKFNTSYLSTNSSNFINMIESTMPVVLDWVIKSNGSCDAEVNVCKENSSCYDVEAGGGYRCKCNHGYQGNPYLDQGCQDINECNDQETYPCHGVCINTVGSYNCTCKSGYFGDANVANGCQPKDSKFSMTILMTATIIGLFAILSGIAVMCFGIRRRKLIRLREKFFEQNGGVLLKQKIESQGSNVAMTLYSTEQLRKATDNYSQEKIIGKGAYGVVYKGVLPDKSVVAIKRSKLVDATQAEQFINEVMILTQVIHRHVVKLLGCCLEEEVPVLVYEFISNNTLFHHIHSRLGGLSWLSWENRLRIATEAASALGLLREGTLEQLQAVGNLVKQCLSFIGDDRPTMREVAMELEGLRKFTTHPWVQQHTCNNETKSLVLEVEQSDLYDVPLIYSTNEWESSSRRCRAGAKGAECNSQGCRGRARLSGASSEAGQLGVVVVGGCYNQGGVAVESTRWIDLARLGYYTYSTRNKFTVVSCDDYALITGTSGTESSPSGCFGQCNKAHDVPNRECSGIGWC
ncbi:hypothetical protein E3N88_01112 [Mikania micrantha]|uniref:Protein kinase domain-containing protein n=1 Tax=Mikania micrantha TaxID=192012 RepID=A0A5N6Q1R6_9ASTR|nr:hypothetical protein E3N88_01112 [Mikania micrantha]